MRNSRFKNNEYAIIGIKNVILLFTYTCKGQKDLFQVVKLIQILAPVSINLVISRLDLFSTVKINVIKILYFSTVDVSDTAVSL